MELGDPANPLSSRGKEGSAEVQGALPLAEAAARDDADTGGLEQSHAVELIRLAALGSGSVNGLLGKGDGGEEVHGALGLAALDALHLLKGLVESVGALAEAVGNAVVLLVVELERGLAGLGRVDHELDEALANDGRAEHDGDELVNGGFDFGVESDKLKVATTVTALAHHALGDTVERGQLDVVVLSGVLLLQLAENALEAVELADEDVGLVDLVGHDDELLLAGEVDHGANISLGQRGSSGVTRVDDDNAADIDTLGLGLFIRGTDGLEVGAPGLGLVEVVGNAGGVEDGEGGGVERVLGDGDEHARLGGLGEDVKKGVDAGRGTGREVDVGRVGGEAISSCKATSCVSKAGFSSVSERNGHSLSRNLAMLSLMAYTPLLAL